ncbi:MAG: YtxH domain-containing protein [Flavobacterium sp.]
MDSSTKNATIALLAGAVVGAGLGILFAPEKGSKTREKIRDGFEDAKNNLKHKIDDLKHRFGGDHHDLEGSFKNLVSGIGQNKEEVINFLEKKLSELKKQKA